MPGKRIAQLVLNPSILLEEIQKHCKLQIANWKFAFCILQLAIIFSGVTGCCRWCERHCGQPACQPTCCQPAYQAQPMYQAQPACCPAPAPAYGPAPVTYQPSYSQWQRPVANGCCE